MAAASSIGKWSVQAGIDARGMQTGAQQAIQSAKGLESSLEGVFGRMGAAVKFPGISIGFENVMSAIGLQSGRQFLEGFTQTVDENLELGFLNDRLGTSVEWLSGLQTVANEVSINSEQFGSAMNRLNMRMGEASLGSAEARRSFSQLGLEWDRLSTQGFEQNFSAIAEALSQVENRSERARLAQELFGRGEGQRILRLMEGGARGLAAAMDDVHARGGFITAEGLSRLQAADDAMDRVTTALSSSWRSFVTTTAPAVTGAFDEINRIMQAIGGAWDRMTGPTALARADQLLGRLAPPAPAVSPQPPLPEFGGQTQGGFGFQGAGALTWSPFGGGFPAALPPGSTVAEREAEVESLRQEQETQRRLLQQRRNEAAGAQADREAIMAGRFDFFESTRSDAQQQAVDASNLANARLQATSNDAADAARRLAEAESGLTAERARAAIIAQTALDAEESSAMAADARRAEADSNEAARITEQVATPFEGFNARMMRLRELFDNGNISAQTFERATGSAVEALSRTIPQIGASPLLGSLSAGSSETASIIQGSMSPQVDRLTEIAAGIEAMREQTEEARAIQEQLLDFFENGEGLRIVGITD